MINQRVLHLSVACLLPLLLVGIGIAQQYEKLAEPALPVVVARFPSFTEGIVFDHQGNAFVSNGRKVWRVTPDGKSTIWVSELGLSSGYPFNGHKVLGDDST